MNVNEENYYCVRCCTNLLDWQGTPCLSACKIYEVE
jgi:hypothetical protein